MTATKNTVRALVTTSMGILCLFIVSGCARNPSRSHVKTREKAVKMPASLDVAFGVESERTVGTRKNIKSGMAYKPATFFYEDIPLPIGVIDVQYEVGQGQVKTPKNKQKGVARAQADNSSEIPRDGFKQEGAESSKSSADWCTTNWCAQGQCAGDSALYYSVGQSVEQLINFYVCNMERLGWQLTADFYTHETVLFFDRYDKRCVIFLSPDKSRKRAASSKHANHKGVVAHKASKTKARASKSGVNKNGTAVTIFVSLRTALL